MTAHKCIQERRLARIEKEAAEMEARRRSDVRLTAKTFRDLASQFGDAIKRMNEAADLLTETAARNGKTGRQLSAHAKQIRALFSRVNKLATKLEPT